VSIDREVLRRLAVQRGLWPEDYVDLEEELWAFANDIAAHQREIDAEFCKSHRIYTKFDGGEKYLVPYIYDLDRHEGVVYAEAIRNMGE
jgi:hypothetical protein